MPTTLILHRWRYYDEVRCRYLVTRHHCTETQIRVVYPDAVFVEGSRELRVVPDDPMSNCTAQLSRSAQDNDGMCGRYALNTTPRELLEHFRLSQCVDFPPRFNIAPASDVPVIRQSPAGERVAGLLRWGLVPHWAKDPAIGAKLVNARGESLAEKPSFRDAFRRRRCLVPVSGFYEWKAEGKARQPHFIQARSGELLALAGLWESWRDPAGEILRGFCLITTGANALMAPIHERMPVLIAPEHVPAWLDPDIDGRSLHDLVAPAADDLLDAWPVSSRVNQARDDDAGLVERLRIQSQPD
jgi:putative SOS response-associated peptidase YedK